MTATLAAEPTLWGRRMVDVELNGVYNGRRLQNKAPSLPPRLPPKIPEPAIFRLGGSSNGLAPRAQGILRRARKLEGGDEIPPRTLELPNSRSIQPVPLNSLGFLQLSTAFASFPIWSLRTHRYCNGGVFLKHTYFIYFVGVGAALR